MSGVIEDEKRRKKLKDHVKEMENTVKTLEDNLKQSGQADHKVMMTLQGDKIKYQGLNSQLQEALKENQQLMNILQQKSEEPNLSRENSQIDINSSCSTMSIVHLQYKYEELLSSHRGLLKLLEVKSDEIRKVHEENVQLRTEVEQLKQNLVENDTRIGKLLAKIVRVKDRKNRKINKLKTHKETLQMVHNQLVNVLHSQCMEKDHLILNEIKNCADSERAQLLQEIRKNHLLAYENFQLAQQLEYLRSLLHSEHNLEQKLA